MVAGRYRLITLVGRGGMGQVWQAWDELLGRPVAVKEVLASPGDSVREARSAARLDHPNVVRVFDVVSMPGRSWIVMELVPSRSLHEVVEQDGPLPHRRAARIGLVLLDALSAAHAAGVLHHDVKPRNVLIGPDGRVVLTDFGLATIGAVAPDPQAGFLMGTPAFVAPERARLGESSENTDLWSLGATLYAAVEGRPPYDRATQIGTLTALQNEDPDPPRHPGPLHDVIAALLARDPRERCTAAQAREGLAAVLRPPLPLLTRRPLIAATAAAGAALVVASGVLLFGPAAGADPLHSPGPAVTTSVPARLP
ncbi:serine/threonine protein kinase [Actinoplanes sp. LDG1-06]|uniref:non-specific serine/threonine protein kinase n=1 Tax=Paractinoplanes ovalisporus TaxID=2810368 RepID=A0ABS2A3R8_9ACTN|nr:serine/threonine-protein kinase [Actinoplanes ovalisporus]MBM2614491.1 serine/threonine protein kinase [Actinoplanes ovalisporus]